MKWSHDIHRKFVLFMELLPQPPASPLCDPAIPPGFVEPEGLISRAAAQDLQASDGLYQIIRLRLSATEGASRAVRWLVSQARRSRLQNRSAGQAVDPNEPDDEEQRIRLMEQELRRMPRKSREALTRFYLHGQCPQKVCQEMGLTENQFAEIKSSARIRFKECLRQRGLA